MLAHCEPALVHCRTPQAAAAQPGPLSKCTIAAPLTNIMLLLLLLLSNCIKKQAPTASTDVDEVTGVLSYQTSGTVPNFPIDWDELTKLTLKFNGQSRYTIEEIEVSDGSWFTLLDASFSIKIVARLRA